VNRRILAVRSCDPGPVGPPVASLQHFRERQPSWATPLLIRGRAAAIWARPERREQARAAMRTLLPDAPDDEIEDLARRHVEFSCRRAEVRYHPGDLVRQDVVGLEHLEAARAEGRGVVLAFLHHGHYAGSFASIAAQGHAVSIVASSESFAPDRPGWLARHIAMATDHPDADAVDVAVGFRGLADLLRNGTTLALSVDGPGPTTVEFLGHPRRGLTSAAGLAFATGAPVVPVSSCRSGRYGAQVVVWPALRACDHADPNAMTYEILAALEHAVLAWPEAYDVPLELWSSS